VEFARHGLPAEAVTCLPRIGSLDRPGPLLDGMTAKLVLPGAAVPVGHDAMYEDSRVASQVGGLIGAEKHGKPEVAVPEQRLDWTYSS